MAFDFIKRNDRYAFSAGTSTQAIAFGGYRQELPYNT